MINLRLTPRASRDEVCGLLGDSVRIRLSAPPVDGKANLALVKFLASRLDVPRSRVSLITGAKGRNKRVLVSGMPADEATGRLIGCKRTCRPDS